MAHVGADHGFRYAVPAHDFLAHFVADDRQVASLSLNVDGDAILARRLSTIRLRSSRLRLAQKSLPPPSSRNSTPTLPLLVISLSQHDVVRVIVAERNAVAAIGIDPVLSARPYFTPQHQNRPISLRSRRLPTIRGRCEPDPGAGPSPAWSWL